MGLTIPLATLEVVMLAAVRIAAFLVIAPPFSHRGIPGTVKAMLAMGLGLAAAPRAAAAAGPTVGTSIASGTATFVGDMLLQVLIGTALGFLVAMVFAAVQSAGNLIDLFGGFQLSQAFDPMSQTNGAQFSRLYQMTAIVLLFASDGYQLVIAGLVRSFDALPLGTPLNLAALGHAATEGLTNLFLAALQVAGPLIVVLFLADVGLGLLTRVAPALNAFALGFPLKILLTLSLGVTAYLALPQIVSTLTDTAVGTMLGVTQ
ncbi:flagellar biosynthetic protein FliR [Cellulomonas sp. KRMCY2]|uniref:flagellar biosynthetic protein FliR n=1 Tax=Cellulomonas sp. KRMCY2 TaxID=1304865 RepID=UPI00045EC5F9|nr:flagellar biosynthetic protein FliR [Cellulomonas sp. KRMCY2]